MPTIYQCWKAVRSDGRSFYNDGAIDYAARVGEWIEQADAAPFEAGQCGPGLHVSPTVFHAIRASDFGDNKSHRPWRFFELAVPEDAILWPRTPQVELFGQTKWRVRGAFVVREVLVEDPMVFGAAFA